MPTQTTEPQEQMVEMMGSEEVKEELRITRFNLYEAVEEEEDE